MERTERLSKTIRKPGELNRLSKAVRLYCIQCFGGSVGEVDGCTSPNCQFWPDRFGSPKTAKALVVAEKKKKNWLTEEEAEETKTKAKKATRTMSDEQKDKLLTGLAKSRRESKSKGDKRDE